MTDVVDLIEQEHREIEDLFAKFESTGDASVAVQICDDLDRHATGEATAVYPVVTAEVPGAKQAVADGEREHADARQLIGRIRRTSDPDHLAALVRALQEAVEHHIDEEESEMLPLARAALDPDRLEQLGREFVAAKG